MSIYCLCYFSQIAIKMLNPRIINNISQCMSCDGKPHFSAPRYQVSLGIHGILNMFTVNAPFHSTGCVYYQFSWWVVLRWFENKVGEWLRSVGEETTAIPGGVRSLQCWEFCCCHLYISSLELFLGTDLELKIKKISHTLLAV